MMRKLNRYTYKSVYYEMITLLQLNSSKKMLKLLNQSLVN